MGDSEGAAGLESVADQEKKKQQKNLKFISTRKFLEIQLKQKLPADIDEFDLAIRDGMILCQLVNSIKSGSIPRIYKTQHAFRMMENANFFISACKKMGVQSSDIFAAADLVEMRGMENVYDCILALCDVSMNRAMAKDKKRRTKVKGEGKGSDGPISELDLSNNGKENEEMQNHSGGSNIPVAKEKKLTFNDFQTVKIIGRGAFGEVRLVRKKDDSKLYALKKMKKAKLLKNDQVAYARSERDLMTIADNEWIVNLQFSFQDPQYLYLVMEYLAGGDLMTLLINKQFLTEDQTRFFIAEIVMAIESIHKLDYIHRDIKPDNILIGVDGHIKLSDFGLCTGMKKEIQDFNITNAQSEVNFKRQPSTRADRMATFKKNRKKLAFSVVGTPDYIAPEVLTKHGYGKECDWWSVGVLLFGMLAGYPPFTADTPSETYSMILNYKTELYFPEESDFSREAKDLILRLLTDRENRLGNNGAGEIKAHPFFRGIDWNNLRNTKAPMAPHLRSEIDTSYFDEYKEEEEEEDIEYVEKVKINESAFYGYTFKR